ncbi:ATP-binding protein [Saccharospirillum sp.]|uniref:ATP-binding protein n=1 Tax=Saccharospirillum sp. TaxID=2033801 RepID=UPI0034A0AB40
MHPPEHAQFGLESIILHHTFQEFSGRTVSLPMAGKTHIAGTNGAGKSSILALLSVFYGTEPERVVSKLSGKSSFIDFYLPTFQSCVIFEYRQEEGLCCALLFRHPSNRVGYYFLKGSAEETLFAPGIRERLAAGIAVTTLIEDLKQAGIRVSTLVNTITDFRAIIQRDANLIKRNPGTRKVVERLSREFGLGDSQTRMQHIDRLVHVVQKNQSMMREFKKMIWDTQFDDHILPTSPKIKEGQALVNDVRSQISFEAEKGSIVDCIDREEERLALSEHTTSIAKSIRTTLIDVNERLSGMNDQLRTAEAKHQDEERLYYNQRGELVSQAQDHDIHYKKLVDQHVRLMAEKDRFDEAEIPYLAQESTQLPEYRRQRQVAKDDLEAITTQVEEFRVNFQADLKAIEQNHKDGLAAIASETELVKHQFEMDRKDHQTEKDSVNAERDMELANLRHSQQEARHTLDKELAQLRFRVQHASASEQDSLQVEEAETKTVLARDAVAEERTSLNALEQSLSELNSEQRSRQTSWDDIRADIERENEKITQFSRQLEPPPGSLLEALRADDSHWSDGLGKIINTDLLYRKDLNPVKINDALDVFGGWSLAVGGLDRPDEAADEAQLHAHIERCESRRLRLEEQARSLETRVHQSAQRLSSIKEELSVAKTQLRKAQNLLSAAEQTEKTIKAQVKERVEVLKAEAQSGIVKLQAQLTEFDASASQEREALTTQYSEQVQELVAGWSNAEAEFEQRRDHLKARADEATRQYKTRKKDRESAYQQILKNNGIDERMEEEYRGRVTALSEKIKRIEGSQSKIETYNRWYRDEWQNEPQLRTDIAAAQREKLAFDKSVKELEEANKARSSKFQAEKRRLEGEMGRLSKSIGEADALLRRMGLIDLQPDEDTPVGNLEALTETLQSNGEKLQALRRNVLAGVKKAKAVINRYDGSHLEQQWRTITEQRIAATNDPDFELDEAGLLSQVQDLKIMINELAPKQHDLLHSSFFVEAKKLQDHLDSLSSLTKQITSVSRKLGSRINTDQKVATLEDFRIVLKPLVQDSPSWQPLQNFVRAFEEWKLTNRTDLPGEGLLNKFSQVMASLRDSGISADRDALFDLEIQMKENGNLRAVRNDTELLNAASKGLNKLAINIIFMGMARYLCPDQRVRIVWPLDELLELHITNITSLVSMLDQHNLTIISASPDLDRNKMKIFNQRVNLQSGVVNHLHRLAHPGDQSQRDRLKTLAGLSSVATQESSHEQ